MNTLLKSNQAGRVSPLRAEVAMSQSGTHGVTHPTQKISAFTMVEIALALAIIGFALVAIIGVLPFGLGVQRQNREETIITQESGYFMDAVRNGRRGLDELTNRIISITNYWTEFNATNNFPTSPNGVTGMDGYTYLNSSVTTITTVAPDAHRLTNGFRIIGLLGRQKFEPVPAKANTLRSNHVVALVRSIAGAATEKSPQQDANVLGLGFNYRMLVEVHDVPIAAQSSGAPLPGQSQSLLTNLHEVRLKFSWPLFPGNRIGNDRLTFRSMSGGQHQTSADPYNSHPIFYFSPSTY